MSEVAKMNEVTDDDIKKLRHMLGANPEIKKPSQFGSRNYYLTANEGQGMEAMRRLETAGLVWEGACLENETYFHANEAGCNKIGFTRTQIRRAI